MKLQGYSCPSSLLTELPHGIFTQHPLKWTWQEGSGPTLPCGPVVLNHSGDALSTVFSDCGAAGLFSVTLLSGFASSTRVCPRKLLQSPQKIDSGLRPMTTLGHRLSPTGLVFQGKAQRTNWAFSPVSDHISSACFQPFLTTSFTFPPPKRNSLPCPWSSIFCLLLVLQCLMRSQNPPPPPPHPQA